MYEKREFFRVKNNGNIHAKYGAHDLEVIEMSSSGVAIIKKDTHIKREGSVEIRINNDTRFMDYKLLRTEQKKMVLVFTIKEEINELFILLKHLKDGG